MTKRKAALLAAKALVTIALATVVALKINVAQAMQLLGLADWNVVVLGGLVCLGALLLGALRWQLLLSAHNVRVRLRAAAVYTYIGQFFNTILPSTIGGDVARGFYVIRDGGPAPAVLLTLALDRVLGLAAAVALTALIVLVQPLGVALPESWRSAAWLAVIAMLGAALLAFSLQPFLISPAIVHRVSLRWPRVAHTLPQLRLRFSALLAAFGVSLLVLLAVGGTFACADAALGPNGLGPLRAIALAGPVLLATALPISVAGWGVREAVLVTLFQDLGLPAELGLATSLLYGFVLVGAGIPGLVLWLRLRRP